MYEAACHAGTVSDSWGIADGYHDTEGRWHDTAESTRVALREIIGDPDAAPPVWCVATAVTADLLTACRLRLEDGSELGPLHRLPPDLPIGYHTLEPLDDGPATMLIVAPARVRSAPRAWGVAAQLYSLRSEGSQGIGDLADLGALMRWVERAGGAAVLTSPLHAPAPTHPQQPSPYYASSRLWGNPLHLRVPGLPEEAGRTLVDRDEVWRRKRSALQSWFLTSSMGTAWKKWVEAQGESLRRYAIWTSLAERLGSDWTRWPSEFRRPDASGIVGWDATDFDTEFHSWCQWLVSRQLAEASRSAPTVSLIGDLAVGVDPGGADAWAFQDTLALGCRVGAPPDPFSASGQDWGLPPFNPRALAGARFAPFIDTVRAALRGVAGLRIDHIMGLFRLWWIPPDRPASEGAYVSMPEDALLGILRVEAHRSGTFLIGEDLGTVAAGVREAMADSGILGTHVAWFESEPPSRWPEECLATITTHDLPTIAGVWQGRDGDAALQHRLDELVRLPAGALSSDATLVAHTSLARSPARLRLMTLEDLCGAVDRPNVPGTTTEFPNWCRRLPMRIEELDERSTVRATVAAFTATSSPATPTW